MIDALVTATALVVAQIPGENVGNEVVTGLTTWAFIIGAGALIVAAILWAVGGNTDNYAVSGRARKGVLLVIVAMIIVGATPTLIEWARQLGERVQ